jgi:hypothetical protein
VVVEPGVEVRREVRVQDVALARRSGGRTLEDPPLQLEREHEREDIGVPSLAQLGPVLDVARLDPVGEQRLLERLEPGLRRREVERGPVPLLRLADADLVRVGVHLRVAVEELAEQRPAGALDLRDEDERLANEHEVLEPHLE